MEPGKAISGTGTGTVTWPNGNRYQGSFRYSELHGLGEGWFDGKHLIGTWENGKFVGGASPAPSSTTLQ